MRKSYSEYNCIILEYTGFIFHKIRVLLHLCYFIEHSGKRIKGFREICVYLDECFVVLDRYLESICEILLASLGVFEFLTELLVLMSERASDEVDGSIASVFKVSVRDVDIAVETREFAVCDHLIFPLRIRVLYGGQIPRSNLFVNIFLRDADQIGGLCDGEIDFVWHRFVAVSHRLSAVLSGFSGCQKVHSKI